MIKTKDNLIGQVFGRLTVIARAEDHIQPSGQKKVMWKCQCSCENKTICEVSGYNLKGQHTTSCGCLVLENTKKMAINNKKNSKITKATKNINKHDLYEYYKCHTQQETALHFNITTSILRKLLKIYNIKKTTEERRYTMTKFIDMTGWIMKEHGVPESRITIVSFDRFFNNQTYWNCLCECGNKWSCNGANVRNGTTLSCGCLHQEHLSEHARKLGHIYGGYNKKYNDYDISNDFGIGYFSIGEMFYFDLEDYDKIKDFYWSKSHGYAVTRIYKNDNIEYIYMHRLVIGAQRGYVVDHIDRNRANNIKNNLRITNNSGNARNASIAKNNMSGFTGVIYDNNCDKWVAQITVNYQNKSLGRFTNKEDAIRARLQAEKEYFGEFAPQRHLFKEYGIEDDFSKEK